MQPAERDHALRGQTNQAIADFQRGDLDAARVRCRAVADDFIGDPTLGKEDADVLNALAQVSDGCRDYDLAVRFLRALARVQRLAPYQLGYHYFRAAANSTGGAEPGDLVIDPARELSGQQPMHVLIACIPKTGSTFLFTALGEVLEVPGPKLCMSYGNEENILSPELVRAYGRADYCAQEHCQATPQNVSLAQAANAHVIILVRNIFDSLVSMRDMLLDDPHGSASAFFQGESFASMTTEQQLDAVVAKWAHWQLEFVVSWSRALEAGRVNGRFLTYETFMAAPSAEIAELCRFLGRPVSEETIAEVLDKLEGDPAATRRNVGISGRGKAELSVRQVERIRSLTAIYPQHDFTMLGLG